MNYTSLKTEPLYYNISLKLDLSPASLEIYSQQLKS